MTRAESQRMSATQHGVALIIGLTLLLLMSLLAMAAMTRTSTELMMAANEQYRLRASQAASAAIEDAIAHLADAKPVNGAIASRGPLPLVDGSLERFSSSTVYAGAERPLLLGTADKFAALHYTISGVGMSARDAREQQTQGVALIVSVNSVAEFNRLERGLP